MSSRHAGEPESITRSDWQTPRPRVGGTRSGSGTDPGADRPDRHAGVRQWSRSAVRRLARLELLDRIAGDLPRAAARADPDRAAERAGRRPGRAGARPGRGGRGGRRQRRRRRAARRRRRVPRPAGRAAGRGRCRRGTPACCSPPVGCACSPGCWPPRCSGRCCAGWAWAANAAATAVIVAGLGPVALRLQPVGRPGGTSPRSGSRSPRPSASGSGRVRPGGARGDRAAGRGGGHHAGGGRRPAGRPPRTRWPPGGLAGPAAPPAPPAAPPAGGGARRGRPSSPRWRWPCGDRRRGHRGAGCSTLVVVVGLAAVITGAGLGRRPEPAGAARPRSRSGWGARWCPARPGSPPCCWPCPALALLVGALLGTRRRGPVAAVLHRRRDRGDGGAGQRHGDRAVAERAAAAQLVRAAGPLANRELEDDVVLSAAPLDRAELVAAGVPAAAVRHRVGARRRGHRGAEPTPAAARSARRWPSWPRSAGRSASARPPPRHGRSC